MIEDRIKHYKHPYLVNWQYGGYSYVEENPNKPERLWTNTRVDFAGPEDVIAIAIREDLPFVSLAGGFWDKIGYKGYGEKLTPTEAERALAKAKSYVLGEEASQNTQSCQLSDADIDKIANAVVGKIKRKE